MEITGKVAVTISRGQVVVTEGEFRGAAGHGGFLSRGLNQYLV
jgi:dihydropyrimidinase